MSTIQSYMPHLCGEASRFHEARRNNAAGGIFLRMQERQKPIADWMRAVMERRDISARSWAEQAKLGKDTVSRAIRDDYKHVTSTTTVAKLAETIGERAPGLAGAVPSAEALAGVLSELHLALLGAPRPSADVVQALAEALRDTLLHLADEPEAADDPRLSSALARASVRSLDRQPA
jgi:hypothetical protein